MEQKLHKYRNCFSSRKQITNCQPTWRRQL